MSTNIKNAILLGPQGSGKSTQGELIAEFLKINIASSGNILREVMSRETELGQKVKSFVNQGMLVPDDLMIELFAQKLQEPNYINGFLLDGFPRNINQAKDLDKHYQIDRVFDIEISNGEAIRRLAGRRICKHGHIWHVQNKPPKQEGVCDDCKEELYAREDDREDLIAKRLFIYRQETTQLLKYYKTQNKLVNFDGQQSIAKVTQNIVDYLKKNA